MKTKAKRRKMREKGKRCKEGDMEKRGGLAEGEGRGMILRNVKWERRFC